jgi:hypothetical protein
MQSAVSEFTPLAEGENKEDFEYVADEDVDRDMIGDRELDAEDICDFDSEALPVAHGEFFGDEETDADKDDVRETETVDDTEEEPDVVTDANFAVEEIVGETVGDKLPLGDGEMERDSRGDKDALGERDSVGLTDDEVDKVATDGDAEPVAIALSDRDKESRVDGETDAQYVALPEKTAEPVIDVETVGDSVSIGLALPDVLSLGLTEPTAENVSCEADDNGEKVADCEVDPDNEGLFELVLVAEIDIVSITVGVNDKVGDTVDVEHTVAVFKTDTVGDMVLTTERVFVAESEGLPVIDSDTVEQLVEDAE